MLGIIATDLIIVFPISFLKLSSSLRAMPAIAATLMQTNNDSVTLGPKTTQFMQVLKNDNFEPVVFKKITRYPFTGDGRLIVMSGDNFQIFEYADRELAMKDASLFASKYTTYSKKLVWKKDMHVYVNDTLVIFYLGKEPSILYSLDQNAVAFVNASQKIEALTRVGN